MGDDLQSIAAHSGNLHRSSNLLGWDYFHSLGVFNRDIISHFKEDSSSCSSTPPFLSPFDSDLSTGYLQDALFEFSSKRRRLLLFSDDQTNEQPMHSTINASKKTCWDSNSSGNYPENFRRWSQINTTEDDTIAAGKAMNRSPAEALSGYEGGFDSSPTSYGKEDSVNNQSSSDNKIHLLSIDPISGRGERRKKRVITRVVYPFAVVKPGGNDEDVTLEDINERILMPPNRPVRHPVGDFACRPLVSPDGPGLSGKAVVALTKIHTKGRGTITIIRTKG